MKKVAFELAVEPHGSKQHVTGNLDEELRCQPESEIYRRQVKSIKVTSPKEKKQTNNNNKKKSGTPLLRTSFSKH